MLIKYHLNLKSGGILANPPIFTHKSANFRFKDLKQAVYLTFKIKFWSIEITS